MGQALSSPDIIPNAVVAPTTCQEAVQAQGLSAWSPSVTKAGRARRWVLREAEGSSLEILPSPPRGLLFGQDPPFLPKNKGRKPGPRQSCPQRIGNTGSKETNATSAWARACILYRHETTVCAEEREGQLGPTLSFCRNPLPLSGLGNACPSHVSTVKQRALYSLIRGWEREDPRSRRYFMSCL